MCATVSFLLVTLCFLFFALVQNIDILVLRAAAGIFASVQLAVVWCYLYLLLNVAMARSVRNSVSRSESPGFRSGPGYRLLWLCSCIRLIP
jgi:hypothetical protein